MYCGRDLFGGAYACSRLIPCVFGGSLQACADPYMLLYGRSAFAHPSDNHLLVHVCMQNGLGSDCSRSADKGLCEGWRIERGELGWRAEDI